MCITDHHITARAVASILLSPFFLGGERSRVEEQGKLPDRSRSRVARNVSEVGEDKGLSSVLMI